MISLIISCFMMSSIFSLNRFSMRLPGSQTTITIGSKTIECDSAHLEQLEELGRGAYGVVEKMRHTPSGTIMAVKVSQLQPFLLFFFHLNLASCGACVWL